MKNILLTLLGIVVLGLTFVIGARVGTQAHLQADAQYKASIAAYNLKALDSNKLDNLRISLEFNVDDNLWLHAQGINNPFLILWPELTNNGNSSLKNAAEYRFQNPRPYVPSKDLQLMSTEEQKRIIERGQQIEALVQEYGQ
jgi:hypothetical protein